jgi:hypothetical protein
MSTRMLLDEASSLRQGIDWRQAALLKYVPGPNRAALAEELSTRAMRLEQVERELVRRGRGILINMKYEEF